jgi:dihydrofolate reductase
MTRIAYATATSLDGYLADANGSLDWLFAVEGGAQAMAETEAFLSGVAVQIEGSTTYRWVIEREELVDYPGKWQTFYGNRKTFVFSSRTDLPIVAGADVEFVSGAVANHLDTIRAAAGEGDIHVVGGGALRRYRSTGFDPSVDRSRDLGGGRTAVSLVLRLNPS